MDEPPIPVPSRIAELVGGMWSTIGHRRSVAHHRCGFGELGGERSPVEDSRAPATVPSIASRFQRGENAWRAREGASELRSLRYHSVERGSRSSAERSDATARSEVEPGWTRPFARERTPTPSRSSAADHVRDRRMCARRPVRAAVGSEHTPLPWSLRERSLSMTGDSRDDPAADVQARSSLDETGGEGRRVATRSRSSRPSPAVRRSVRAAHCWRDRHLRTMALLTRRARSAAAIRVRSLSRAALRRESTELSARPSLVPRSTKPTGKAAGRRPGADRPYAQIGARGTLLGRSPSPTMASLTRRAIHTDHPREVAKQSGPSTGINRAHSAAGSTATAAELSIWIRRNAPAQPLRSEQAPIE